MERGIYRRRCHKQDTLSKRTFLAMLEEGSSTANFFDKLTDDQWSITSFDAQTRQTCVKVTTDNNTSHLSITLPYLSASSLNR